ncbi:hypothetical protein HSX44_02375 [Wolbachia endosymbiont of Onchocerca gibsoni]|nr:hypothetical protein [Wolbachia endosymbiont of Onchocerca gibsoni]MDF0607581.1 hypothetical protein [Wolbachia endosymbiont of Onchocerca gibsoni]MDF0607734.1 hypothetical protein [Wolbachia endosymbiont of Onchocerca gibsoni]
MEIYYLNCYQQESKDLKIHLRRRVVKKASALGLTGTEGYQRNKICL